MLLKLQLMWAFVAVACALVVSPANGSLNLKGISSLGKGNKATDAHQSMHTLYDTDIVTPVQPGGSGMNNSDCLQHDDEQQCDEVQPQCTWCDPAFSGAPAGSPRPVCLTPQGCSQYLDDACGSASAEECENNDGCTMCSSIGSCVATNATGGSRCFGCDGNWNSGLRNDACGVCGGNNQTCLGCDGVPNSGKEIDECGLCGGDSSSCFHLSTAEYLGIVMAIMGNALIALSLNAQKYAHNENAKLGALKLHYTKLPLWWFSTVLMALGECGNFMAYAYAPATIVAPLGSVSVMTNAILAHLVLKEPLWMRNIAGCGLAVLGSVLIVMFAPSSDHQLTMARMMQYVSEPSYILFLCVVIGLFIALRLTPIELKEKYVVIYTSMCSLLGSVTVMCTKALSTSVVLTISGTNQFKFALPWVLLAVIGITVVFQLRYLNKAMIVFGASEVVPVYYVLFTFSSVLTGIVLFKEFHENGPGYTWFFLFGCAMTFSGVFLITSIRHSMSAGDNGAEFAQLLAEDFEEAGREEGSDEDSDEDDPLSTRLAVLRV